MGEPDGATPLARDETEGLRLAHVSTREELNEVEQANIASGLAWPSRRRRPDVLSDDFLRTLHRRLFGEVWSWAGQYRRTEKNIGIDPARIAVETHVLFDARYWIDRSIFDPVEIAIRFHHRLVFIHLFPNGNGRHARIAADALMEKTFGLAPIDWDGGNHLQSLTGRRKQYIAALRSADGHDFGPLLAFARARRDPP
ncbi:MAG TPA: mobile mystery protein B [Bauldia sp.]|nr:mobile mystery protein B [Bauldia sp.]